MDGFVIARVSLRRCSMATVVPPVGRVRLAHGGGLLMPTVAIWSRYVNDVLLIGGDRLVGPVWRWAAAVAGALATVAVVAWLGLLNWLPANAGPARNALEGLSWLAGITAVVGGAVLAGWRGLVPRQSGQRDAARSPLVDRVSFLVDGRLPRVDEVGLIQLRVKPSIDTQASAGTGLPPYVPRDVDEDVEWAITTGGIVLLHGPAASGKSRTAAEALRRLRPGYSLVVPVDGPAFRSLVDSGVGLGDAVIWLDDLEHYLVPGGLDLPLLQRLCPPDGREPGASPVALVATIRDHELAAYDNAAVRRDPRTGGIDRAAVDLVAHVRGRRRIRVAQWLSDTERAAAVEVAGRDARIGDAVRAREGFAEYLAAGTALLDRWCTGDGPLFQVGQAIISTAVDCRRAGLHRPVPGALLAEMFHHYLAPGWRDRADLPSARDGLVWASAPVLGASSCVQPRADDAYLASDYLLDRAQEDAGPLRDEQVPHALWFRLIDLSSPLDVVTIGLQAYRAELLDIAKVAFTKSADSGDLVGVTNLGVVLQDEGDLSRAEELFRTVVDAGDVSALNNLGIVLHQQGRLQEAEDCYQQAIEAGIAMASYNLGILRKQQGRLEEAVSAYRRAVDAGIRTAPLNLGNVFQGLGRNREAEHFFYQAIDEGDIKAANSLGILFAAEGRSREAEQFYRQAIDGGVVEAIRNLGVLFVEEDRPRDAENVFRQAIDAGSIHAHHDLADLLVAQGRPREAEDHYRQAIEASIPQSLFNLGLLRQSQGKLEEAEQLYRRAGDAGVPDALLNLGVLLAERDRPREAEACYRSAIDAGHIPAWVNLGVLFKQEGRLREAEECYRQALDAGHTKALLWLGVLCKRQGRLEEAENHYRRAVEAGFTEGLYNLGVVLQSQGRPQEAEDLYRRAVEAGDTNALNNLGALLHKEGRFAEAETVLRQAVGIGDTAAMLNLGLQHERQGRAKKAEVLYRRAFSAGDLNAVPYIAALLAQQDRRRDLETFLDQLAPSTGYPKSVSHE